MGQILQAVLGVLGILALIAVAVFIILFLSDLVLSVIEGRKGIFFSRGEEKVKSKEKVEEETNDLAKEEQKSLTYIENESNVDFDRAEFEKQLMDEEDLALEERRKQILQDAKTNESNEEAEEDLDALYAKLINEINDEVKSEENNVADQEEVDEDIDFDEIVKFVDGDTTAEEGV